MFVPRVAKKGEMIKTYGWVMNWQPFRSVERKKLGDELTIKTVFKKRYGTEIVSVYVANVLVKDQATLERIKTSNEPLPVLVQGYKKGERAYMNVFKNDMEPTDKLFWIYLNARGTNVSTVDSIPADVLQKTGVQAPSMTFKKFMASEERRRAKLKRPVRA